MVNLKRSDLDLNNDGVFDAKDKSIAAKVLASKIDKKDVPVVKAKEVSVKDESKKEESPVKKESKEAPVKEESKEIPVEGRMAVVDISRMYRKGDMVPRMQIEEWQEMGLVLDRWF